MGNHDAVRKLLRSEANLGLKNGWGEVPLSRISVKCLKEFLDQVAYKIHGL